MIKVYDGFTDDFSGQGLGYIMPISAEIEEEPGGMYEIEVVLPIDDSRDDWVIDQQRIISALSPTRTSPELNFGVSGEIERQIFKANAKAQMYNLKNRKKKLKKYKKNTEFVRIDIDGEWYKVAAVKGGATGWIKTSLLDYVRAENDKAENDEPSRVVENVLAREQLFRIYNIKRDTERLTATVLAEHISYDLKGVICAAEYAPENAPADEVVAQLIAYADQQDLPFNIYCQCTNLVTADYSGRNLIDCLLNSDDGVAAQCNARVVRDNYSIYLLDSVDRYTGVDIRYGDNLISAVQENDSGSTITRIRPVGKTKNGDLLYITKNGGYVESPNAQNYAVQRTKQIDYDVQVGKNGIKDTAAARAKLEELAMQDFENGADAVASKIDTEFVRRELTLEYADIASENALHMYDIAKVKAGNAGVLASVRMGAYKFDALPGRERYITAKITDLADNEPIVYGINIAGGSVSGSKIANNSIDGTQKIKNLSVGIGKFDQAAIDQLNANSITAVTGAIGTLEVTDALYANFARIFQLAAGSIEAGDIETDQLAAQLAKVVSLTADVAEIGYADIKDLTTDEAIITDGVANSLYINRLAVTSANILNATLGELVLKGEDGLYYKVFVGSDGTMRTEAVSVSDGEIEIGVTDNGNHIVETNINAESLNTASIKGESAIIAEIFTQALTAGKITAAEAMIATATIPALYTTSIEAMGNSMTFSANERIQFILGEQEKVGKWIDFNAEKGMVVRKPAWTDKDGIEHPASPWSTVTDETGFHVQSADVPGRYVISVYKDRLQTNVVEIGNSVYRSLNAGGVAVYSK